MSTATGLNLLDFEKAEDAMRVNAGAICEEFIGQHLLFSQQPYCEPEVCYWLREKKDVWGKNPQTKYEYVVFFTAWDHAERGRAYFLQSVQRAPDLSQDNQSFEKRDTYSSRNATKMRSPKSAPRLCP
jgi:hypothetical protein